MNRKNEFLIFFATLITIGVVLWGGITYFKTQPGTDGLLADVATNFQPQSPAVETIPTSTIVTPAPASSSSIPMAPLVLPYTLNASTSNATYWPKAWGDVSFADNGLALIPDPTTHGANSFLNGASSWANYAVSANVSSLMGGWFDIVARVTNNTQSFVYCEFGPNGTEAIERVDGVDTQLALTSASTTGAQDVGETFGIKVYGNDVGCMMNNREVVGVTIANNDESQTGGIGFVIFGAPQEQKQVEVSDVSVSPLSNDTIIAPFPIPPTPTPAPTATATPSPSPSPSPSPTPAPTPKPAPVAATTTKTLPYSINFFTENQGWNTWWGNFSLAPSSLTMGAATNGTSGGVLLNGTNAWKNYTFTATLDWTKGETFGLYARYTNAQNYVLCYYDEKALGDLQISFEQHINGKEYTLAQGTVNTFDQWGGSNLTASIQVDDSQGSCSLNGYLVSTIGTGNSINPPFSGKIGFTTWDPNLDNSQIVVKSINVTSNN
jgi:hypothetical protein